MQAFSLAAVSLPPFPPELEAALADRYRIERELGHGGMATVYLAHDYRHDRPVALKVLRPELSGVLGAARFVREITIVARLTHPHILPVYDSDTLALPDGSSLLFFAMPYVPGRSLRGRLEAEPQLPVEEAVGIARQVAEALDYAHGQGIIHRDIKPENILLAEGAVLVADFGIARALDAAGGERLTETGLALGTPAYMSPEQGAGSSRLDGRADIYALGCVLYEMLAGQPPFTGPTAQAILARHAVDPTPSLRTVRPSVSTALSRVVTRALAKVPADRFATAREFGAALATPEASGPVDAPTAATPARVSRRRLVRVAVTVVAALAVAFAVLARVRNGTPVEADPAVVAIAPFRVAAADPSLDYLREGMVDLLAAKLGAEAGLRAVDPHAILSAWRRVAGPEGREVPADAALGLAHRLGAGRLIDGSVVGIPGHLTLSASLLRSPGGQTLARASVEGPIDSLSILLDRLVARLVALDAGVEVSRLSAISSSLPAIHAFLAGRAAFRKGQLNEAFRQFRDATVSDSTFALAAFELVHVSQWMDGGEDADRGARLAQAGRSRLSSGDRALLDAWPSTGPVPTGPEYLHRWQKATEAYPDRAEVWYWLGDAYYHNGQMVGLDDPFGLAEQAFRRGWALDSANAVDSLAPEHSLIFAEPLNHMVTIAQMKGDTASVLRLVSLGLSADSTSGRVWDLRWHRALAMGDSARRAFWADSAHIDPWAFGQISQFISATGYGSQDWLRSMRLDTRSEENGQPGVIASSRVTALLNGGKPHEARRILYPDSTSTDGLADRLLAALYWQQDTSGTGKAARLLASRAAGDLRHGDAGWEQLRALCTVALWRAAHKDFDDARVSIQRLRRTIPTGLSSGDSIRSTQYATLCATLLDAMRASALRLPDARAKLAEADEAARTYNLVRTLAANLVVARIAEAEGDLALALKAVRRRAGDFAGFQWYLSTFLREEGRLATLTGDTAGAIRAYQHFLFLRPDPEPEMRAESEQVRDELAGLLQETGP